MTFGVLRSPERFLQDALQLTHPFDNPLIVLGQLRKYLRLAVELSSDEARLHEGLRPDLEPVLQGKRLLLFKAMMEDAGVADPLLFQHMVDGFPLVGHLEVGIGIAEENIPLGRKGCLVVVCQGSRGPTNCRCRVE